MQPKPIGFYKDNHFIKKSGAENSRRFFSSNVWNFLEFNNLQKKHFFQIAENSCFFGNFGEGRPLVYAHNQA